MLVFYSFAKLLYHVFTLYPSEKLDRGELYRKYQHSNSVADIKSRVREERWTASK